MTIACSRGFALGLVMLMAASPVVAKDKKPVDPNKKVCRSETPTGSHFPVRTCHTAAEWAEIESANAAAAQSTLDHASRQGAQQ